MLSAFLEELRQKEISKNNRENARFDFDIKMNTRIARYIRDNFDLTEFTTHYYDHYGYSEGQPRTFKERMQFNNWVDVEGPGIWGMSIEEVNNDAFTNMLDTVKRKCYYEKVKYSNNNRWHIFLYDDVIFLYWFGRDIGDYCNNDKWWIYEPKNTEKMIDFTYFCRYECESHKLSETKITKLK